MISYANIRSIAKYERKTLFRSWFFKIFAILTLLILFSMNMGVFVESNTRWTGRAIPANLPYLNVLFVNVAQAIIAVFLASDFLRRDKKLDTTEVIYARPISNGEYVVGKTLGILSLFLGLLLVVLAIGLTINLILQDLSVAWLTYLLYPLLISIPTLVFILGLAFFLMIVLKNQAVTFIVLLGYIGLSLFYFQDKVYGLLDYMAFHIPMAYSDIIGFAHTDLILLQRGAYFCLGLGFIFATIRFLPRLAQVGRYNYINLIAFVLLIGAGSFMGYQYFSIHNGMENERKAIRSLNNKYAAFPEPDVLSSSIILKQKGRSLQVSSEVKMKNDHNEALDTLLFSLNPGFKLDSIIGKNGSVDFTRKRHLVFIYPEEALRVRTRDTYTFYYSGIPVATTANLDVVKDRRYALKRFQVANFSKDPLIVEENYLLLNSELFWYPTAGVGFNNLNFRIHEFDFQKFNLEVYPNKGLTAVAQGEVLERDNSVVFVPEMDLSRLSLVIGDFEKRSMQIEGIDYNLYLKPDHDYFSDFFSEIKDTIPALIQEAREEYEYDELDLYYSFKRINLVETPVNFHAYERHYMESTEYIQPEMIYMPEKGAGLNTMDFRRLKKGEERRNKERKAETSEEDMQISIFKNFVVNTFFRDRINMRGGFRGRGERLITFYSTDDYSENPYLSFPLYYSYVSGISSDEYPIFNAIIEQYFKEGFEVSMRQTFTGGLSDTERANVAMKKYSISEILERRRNGLVSATIFQAGSFSVNALINKVGKDEFNSFLYYYIEDHMFSELTFDRFARDFRYDLDVEIEDYLEFMGEANRLPEFLISTPEFIQTRDEYGDVYLVKLKASNIGNSKGLLELSFRMPGGGFGGGGSNEPETHYVEIPADSTKDVQLVFYDQPRLMTVNTLISGNIPSSFNVFLRSADVTNIKEQKSYVRNVEEKVELYEEGEIVVDNEDEDFELISVSHDSKVKQYVDSRKEEDELVIYKSISPWWTPSIWTPVSHSGLYGELIRSGYYVRSGDGANVATWKTDIPEAGFYDIYVYIPVSAMYKRPERRRNNQQGGQDGPAGGGQSRRMGPQFADKGTRYHYTISSPEGVEEVELHLTNPEDGWNRLGSFHFPADSASVSLSNETNGKRVFADAVKWVKR